MTLDMINETLFFNVHHLVANVHVYHEGKNHQKLSSDEIWSTVYNKEYGLCYTLDIRKEETLKICNEPLVLAIEYYPEERYPISTFCAYRVKQLIHHEKDLPTAMKFNELYHSMGSFGTYEYNIRKMNYDIGGFHIHLPSFLFTYQFFKILSCDPDQSGILARVRKQVW